MTEAVELVVRQSDPYNAETPLRGGMPVETPTPQFYVRSHFPLPATWRGLDVTGDVMTPIHLGLDDVKDLPRHTISTTMECAGNGRAFLDPPTSGVAWQLGAVATATWTGCLLSKLLGRVGVRSTASELVFRGGDHGRPAEISREIHYERSFPVREALVNELLLAYDMNGEPLSPEHGAPLRLIVPGWYGMASVKWLEEIAAVREPFGGYYQVEDYVMRAEGKSRPCREMAVRAIITSPAAGSVRSSGRTHVIEGLCWSGWGEIAGVDVSCDGGEHWVAATVEGRLRRRWTRWSAPWTPDRPGRYSLLSKARDWAGNIQPLTQVWNERGYGNNAAVPVDVEVVEQS